MYVEYEHGDLTGFHGATVRSPKFPPPPRYNADENSRYYQTCKVSN
jgi:hypothetical protein